MSSRDLLLDAKRIVVKVGSTLLADSPAGRPAAIADELAELSKSKGIRAVVISSGAIALGAKALGLSARPATLPLLQASAAVGQTRLMRNWEHAFGAHNMLTGQILITHDDFSNRARFLNARHALRELLEAGVVPVVNENDTVAVDEIKYGDNDILGSLVANLVGADALILLTDVDGLHDAHPNSGGKRIPLVEDVDGALVAAAGGSRKGGFGSGGMASKVQAAKAAVRFGVPTVVAAGQRRGVLSEILQGADLGTLFAPSSVQIDARKHWIAYGAKPASGLQVDAGAVDAVVKHGKSLLPAGLVEVRGTFEVGDIVSLVTPKGREFARGLAAYGADEMRKIKGLQSAEIEQALGYRSVDELIHRDDLVLL